MKGLSSLSRLLKGPIPNYIRQRPSLGRDIQGIRRQLGTPTILSLRMVSTSYDENNGVQLGSWQWFEFW